MSSKVVDVQSFIARRLHSLLFIEEFVFARNKFTPPASSELELADAVVMLGDALLIYQIKERSVQEAGDADAERRWFEAKVLGKATKQLRDTLRHLQAYPEINVPNERGHVFNLAAREFREVIKVVVYLPSRNLPDDCRRIRSYVSRSAGFMHVLDARDYVELSRMLRVPEEVIRYFGYREAVLTQFPDACLQVGEPAIAGHFIGGAPDEPPTAESIQYLHRLVDDSEEWDLIPLMRGLYDHLSTPGISNDHYQILIEFARLPRSMWREIKKRISLCIEKVRKGEFAQPYRMTVPERNCGFVFVPTPPEIMASPDWPAMRLRAIQNFTLAHKYDQRLPKCIGVQVSKDGEYFDIYWCLITFPWEYDADMQKALAESFPFRPVKEGIVHGYRLAKG